MCHSPMRFVFGLCLLVAIRQCLWSAETATIPDYSKEGMVLQHVAKSVSFEADGRWTAQETTSVRVQSEATVRQLGVLSFGYDQRKQKVKIGYVRVVKADGTVVTTPEDNVQDISSEVSRVAPTYSDLREKQVPVKALSPGDLLEYQITTIQTEPDIEGQFWYSSNFLTGVVVLDETLHITVPSGKYVKVVSAKLQPTVTDNGSKKEYVWKSSELRSSVEQMEHAKDHPEPPRSADVQLTTFQNWSAIGTWYRQLQMERVVPTDAVKKQTAEVTAGLTTDEQKTRAIYRFVATRFRYISLSFGVGRYQPHAAEEVLANQYGDCKDKHTLFASMLKAAGIEAWPVLIGAGIKLDENVPSPAQFNHVITVIPDSAGRPSLWLDTTPEVAPFGVLQTYLRDEKGLVIPPSGAPYLSTTPPEPPFSGSELLDVKATLDDKGTLKGHFDFTSHCDGEVMLRSVFHQTPAAQWEQVVQGFMQQLGFGGTVSHTDVDNPDNLDKPFHFSFDYEKESYSGWSDKQITPPLFPMSLPLPDEKVRAVEPLLLGGSCDMTYRAVIQLPKAYSATPPANKDVSNDWLTFKATFTSKDGVVTADRHLKLLKPKVAVDRQEKWRTAAKDIVESQGEWIKLASTSDAFEDRSGQGNPASAEALVNEAAHLAQAGNRQEAERQLKRAEQINPKQLNLWLLRASLDMMAGQEQKYVEDLRQELTNHPENLNALNMLAMFQRASGKKADASATLLKALKAPSPTLDEVKFAAQALISDGLAEEVEPVVRPLLERNPDDRGLSLLMGEVLLRTNQKDEALKYLQRGINADSNANDLNTVSYALAEAEIALPQAESWGKGAVEKTEQMLKDASLSSFGDRDLGATIMLAHVWDTLGWVYFKEGDLPRARSYLQASWAYLQDGTVADHLGQVLDKQGQHAEAVHVWRLALAANRQLSEVSDRLKALGEPKLASVSTDRTRSRDDVTITPEEELSKIRTVGLPAIDASAGTAEYWVLFEHGKPSDAAFISGADQLANIKDALLHASFGLSVPDDGPEKLIRRGIASCSAYTKPKCQFVLMPIELTHH